MPLETTPSSAEPESGPPVVSVIENEIPAYRAVSPGAVFALILGVASILSYSSLYFLAVAVLAVIVGVRADRKILRFPDMLTGRRLAHAGIALGLIFGVSSFTIDVVQGLLRKNAAARFARGYEKVIAKGSLDDLVWYGQTPDRRKSLTPEKLVAELKSKGGDPQMFKMQYQGLYDLKDRVNEPKAEVHYQGLEGHGDDGLAMFAAALYEIHSPENKVPAQKETYALALIRGVKDSKGKVEWFVQDMKFPYTPSSYVMPSKPVDDGHGHGEGGHSH